MSASIDTDAETMREVAAAAERLVAAFGEGRVDDYFDAFHAGATFVFHTVPHRLESRQDYRKLWRRWEKDDGFRVLGVETSDTRIQRWGDVAVLSHTVRTRQQMGDAEVTVHERETIVFARQADGRWLAVHEHLSPAPSAA